MFCSRPRSRDVEEAESKRPLFGLNLFHATGISTVLACVSFSADHLRQRGVVVGVVRLAAEGSGRACHPPAGHGGCLWRSARPQRYPMGGRPVKWRDDSAPEGAAGQCAWASREAIQGNELTVARAVSEGTMNPRRSGSTPPPRCC